MRWICAGVYKSSEVGRWQLIPVREVVLYILQTSPTIHPAVQQEITRIWVDEKNLAVGLYLAVANLNQIKRQEPVQKQHDVSLYVFHTS